MEIYLGVFEMQNKGNRDFKELLEKVYEQKFDNKNYIKKLLEGIKTIPNIVVGTPGRLVDHIVNNKIDISCLYF